MNVASLGLCRELYELSGWSETDYTYYANAGQYSGTVMHRSMVFDKPDNLPAYDTGFLLRKLPAHHDDYHLGIEATTDGKWAADYITNDYTPERPVILKEARAETPEDALCRLAIALFKAGVLKKGGHLKGETE